MSRESMNCCEDEISTCDVPTDTHELKSKYMYKDWDGTLRKPDQARAELAKMEGKTREFSGTFSRYGTKTFCVGAAQTTILLKDVIDIETGIGVADHLWFTAGKRWEALGALKLGQKLRFMARVEPYRKGYKGRNTKELPLVSWRLSGPTEIRRV